MTVLLDCILISDYILLQVFFYPPRDHMVYDTIGLGNTEPVLRDMVMSADEDYFYVPTESKVPCLAFKN